MYTIETATYTDTTGVMHRMAIRDYKTSLGFRATCTCGERLGGAQGCNGGGRVYAMCDSLEQFAEHITQQLGVPHTVVLDEREGWIVVLSKEGNSREPD